MACYKSHHSSSCSGHSLCLTVTAAATADPATAAAAAAAAVQLYSRLVGFVADMISGGEEVLVDMGRGPQQGPQLLLPATALRHDPFYRTATPARYEPHRKDKVGMTRDVAKDTGWVGGQQGSKRGREFA
jgi:hypothetical protein